MSAFPATLQPPVKDLLRSMGDDSAIQSAHPIGGGCINNATRLQTEKRSYLLKWNFDPLPRMFACEARGLELLARTNTVWVPEVYGHGEASGSLPAYILLEWLEGARYADPARLGEQLANLHRSGTSPQEPLAYGLDENNYLGSTEQINHWETSWPQFFAACRLHPQMELAARNGRLHAERRQRLERLIERLPELLTGVPRLPALIHGDLWGGNVISSAQGLALIDPAVSYSDREAEIAYTELFGGFSERFYEAYQDTWPLPAGYSERRDLYNLYHLLNHLNLFGESYGSGVDAVLRRYTTK